MNLKNISEAIDGIVKKYELKLLYSDHTDTTLITRIGFSIDLFIQIYANVKKEKINMSLVVTGERIYGIDKEGGFYHEHPFENPSLHIDTEQVGLEDFVIKSLDILEKINLF